MKTLGARTSLGAALALPLLLSACGGGGDSPSSPPPTAHSSHGLMQLTINGLGSAAIQAQAASLHAGPQALVAGLGNDGDALDGLDVEQVSAGTVDVGTRGAGGMRYITVVYRVRNARFCGTPGTCTPYTTASQNLSFVAANVAASLDGTAVTAIYREDGSTDATEQALAVQMLPVDGMKSSNPAGGVVLADGQASLQVFNESEIVGAFVDPDANYLFPYGYVVENVNTPGSRSLPANPANNQWDGQLTFAFKVPLQASPKNDPYSVSFIFDVLDDSNTRVTESVEEQAADGDVIFNQLATTLGGTDLAVLGGRIAQTNIGDPICTVRTAGPVSAPTAYLANNGNSPTAASAPANLVLSPSATLNFGFCTPMDSTTATPATVTVSGNESGPHSGSFSGNGNLISFTPSTAFMAGETVSFTLTTGLHSGGGAPLTQAAAGSFIVGGVVPSSGTFATVGNTPTAGNAPHAVAIGDFNHDGKPDLATANASGFGNISILLGNGDGTFATAVTYPVGAASSGLAVGDFNGDGKQDLAVIYDEDATVAILLGNGDGTFAAAVTYPVGPAGAEPFGIAAADFNGDGKQDLVVANFNTSTLVIVLGNGDGSFGSPATYTVGNSPNALVVGDFNGDGKMDVATSNGDNTISVLLGNGDGSFAAASIGTYPVGGEDPDSIAVGDFNGDGKLDLVVSNVTSGDVSILLGKGDGTFAAASIYPVGQGPQAVVAGDFNGDGKLDLAVPLYGDSAVAILLGKGDGTFAAAATQATDQDIAVAAGDLNGDGKLDLALLSLNFGHLLILKGQ